MTARRSFVLLAVLVIVSSALLITTGLLFVAQAEVAAGASTTSSAQARAHVMRPACGTDPRPLTEPSGVGGAGRSGSGGKQERSRTVREPRVAPR